MKTLQELLNELEPHRRQRVEAKARELIYQECRNQRQAKVIEQQIAESDGKF